MGLEQSKHELWPSKAEQLRRSPGSMPGMGRPPYRSANELLPLPVMKTDGNQPASSPRVGRDASESL